MKLDALLSGFPGLALERPPELWETQAAEPVVRALLAAMLAALRADTLNANNVVVDYAGEDEPGHGSVPAGEFVALSVLGPSGAGPGAGIEARLLAAGARHAYVQRLGGRDSITVFLDRA